MKGSLAIFAALFAFGIGTALAADEWGIEHEEATRFEATVVDILCELTGDCPAGCGGGKRQLGLLRDDGTLLLAAKNFDPFAGAVNDLISFCGKRIVADGLMIGNPKMPLYALQFKRLAPEGEWARANWFTRDWAKAHGVEPKAAATWFRKDEAVIEHIATYGIFGIPGLEPEE